MKAKATKAAKSAADPVFALIDAHKAAEAKFNLALDEFGAVEGRHIATKKEGPALAAAKRMEARTSSVADAALKRLCNTVPQTPAGYIAWLEYLQEEAEFSLVGACRNRATDHLWENALRAAKRLMTR